MIRKIILTLSIFLISISAFAQNSDTKEQNRDNRTWLDENYKKTFPYPITLGVYGFYDAAWASNSGYTSDTVNCGGGAITAKLSFFKWLAIALDISYSGGSIDYGNGLKEDVGTFLFSPMVVFQWETLRQQAGFAPFLGIGISIADNKVKGIYNDDYGDKYIYIVNKSGIGFIMNAGLNYNFKNNVFIGGRFDYSASSFGSGTMNNVRIGIQSGYRF